MDNSADVAVPQQTIEARPVPFQGDLHCLPDALSPLVELNHWVIWRWELDKKGKWTKPPRRTKAPYGFARNNDPSTWGSYAEALAAYEAGQCHGIGFNILGCNIAAFDIDNCRDPETGEIAPEAMAIVDRAASYTEMTVSGTGLRVIGWGDNSNVHRRQKIPGSAVEVESYRDAERYIVITSNPLEGTWPHLADISGEMDDLVRELDDAKKGGKKGKPGGTIIPLMTLPEDLEKLIEEGVPPHEDLSSAFHHAVCWLGDRGWNADRIEARIAGRPIVPERYNDRLGQEIERCLRKREEKESQQRDEPPQTVRLLSYGEYRKQLDRGGSFLIKGLFRTGTLVSINARPGWGKTTLLIEICRCLDAGAPFLEKEVKQAVCLYFAAEDGDDVANRLEALDLPGVKIVHSDEGIPLAKPERAAAIVREAIRQARELFPGREIFIAIDTLRSGLGGQSVLDDRFTSPALNALRKIAEDESAVIAITNHTNRENTRQTKGETLESLVSTELILTQGEGDWYALHVGKNRSGRGNTQIARLRYTSVEVNGVNAAILDEIVEDMGAAENGEATRKPGTNQKLILRIMQAQILIAGFKFRPYGFEGPEVTAVKEGVLREEFIKQKAGESRDNKRRSFSMALDGLITGYQLMRTEKDDEGVIWFVQKDDEKPEESNSSDYDDE